MIAERLFAPDNLSLFRGYMDATSGRPPRSTGLSLSNDLCSWLLADHRAHGDGVATSSRQVEGLLALCEAGDARLAYLLAPSSQRFALSYDSGDIACLLARGLFV